MNSRPGCFSLIIITYDGWELLEPCLRALLARDPGPDRLEIIVVDNGSRDGTPDRVRAAFGNRVRMVVMEENTGFARANNAGARAARGEWLLFLNNDATVAGDFFGAVADGIARYPRTSAFSILMRFPDCEIVENAGIVLARTGFAYAAQRDRHLSVVPDGAEIFGACGGAFLIRRELYLRLGGFEERYFAYMEDVEFSWRLREAGESARVLTHPVIFHAHQQTARRLPRGFLLKISTLNRWRTWLIHWPWPVLLRNLPLVVGAETIYTLWALLFRRSLGDLAGKLALFGELGWLGRRRAAAPAARGWREIDRWFSYWLRPKLR